MNKSKAGDFLKRSVLAADKEDAREYIERNLEEGDKLIGYFKAEEVSNNWLVYIYIIINSTWYYLAVSEKGLYFHELDGRENVIGSEFFRYSDFENVKIGKGFLLARTITFRFKDNRKLRVKALLKGVEGVATLKEDVQQHIENKIPSK